MYSSIILKYFFRKIVYNLNKMNNNKMFDCFKYQLNIYVILQVVIFILALIINDCLMN